MPEKDPGNLRDPSTDWRFGRGWSDDELRDRLAGLRSRAVNFDAPPGATIPSGSPWQRYFSEAVIGHEPPGKPLPDGPFARAWHAIENYQFSDPGIIVAHYDPREPLIGRTMLLEIQVLGLRYLCGTRVAFTRDRQTEARTIKGYRYDTLDGHFEVGSEWFFLFKDHVTGDISFRIHASWRMGEFPNWWSRLGFHVLGHRYQLTWNRLAYLRLRKLLGSSARALEPVPAGRDLVHAGAREMQGYSQYEGDQDLWILRGATPVAQAAMLGGRTTSVGEVKDVTEVHLDQGAPDDRKPARILETTH